MRRRPLREELREVFDDLSEPAHPALSARIRQQIANPPPSAQAPRLAVAFALVATVLIVASLILVGRHAIPLPPTTPAGQPTSVAQTPAPTTAPTQTQPAVVPSGSAPTANLPAFTCTAQSGGGVSAPAPLIGVTDVRAGPQSGYDRFVIQLNGPVPHYDVTPQSSATFVQDASGAPVTLAGSAGLAVRLHGAQSHGTYNGQADQHPAGTAVLREARQTGDFEGVVSWGLGLSHTACFRAFTLTGPARLVIDIKT
jgi:hypothetical protein